MTTHDLVRILRRQIRDGKTYPIDTPFPSEKQLFTTHDCARATVRSALKVLETEKYIERRSGNKPFVCDWKSTVASEKVLAILNTCPSSTEIFKPIWGEIVSRAQQMEYAVVPIHFDTVMPDQDLSKEAAISLAKDFIEQKVSGVFFVPHELHPEHEEINHKIAEMFHNAGRPLVLLDRDLVSFPHRSQFDIVGLDNFAAGFLIADHLYKLKCKKLAWVSKPFSASTIYPRIAGVREAARKHKINIDEVEWIKECNPTDERLLYDLLNGGWDAVICANDLTAIQLIRAIRKSHPGKDVPKDLRVVGFDNVNDPAVDREGLTTIEQNLKEIAETAFNAMMERILNINLPARSLLLSPKLITRTSCGNYPDDNCRATSP